jgi:hypothetical protein
MEFIKDGIELESNARDSLCCSAIPRSLWSFSEAYIDRNIRPTEHTCLHLMISRLKSKSTTIKDKKSKGGILRN